MGPIANISIFDRILSLFNVYVYIIYENCEAGGRGRAGEEKKIIMLFDNKIERSTFMHTIITHTHET